MDYFNCIDKDTHIIEIDCLKKLYFAIEDFDNQDFQQILKLGLDKDYTKRLNEEKIIKVLEKMIDKDSIVENKKDDKDKLMI